MARRARACRQRETCTTYLADTAHTDDTQDASFRIVRQGKVLQPVALSSIHLGVWKLSQCTDEQVESGSGGAVVDGLRRVRHLDAALGCRIHIDRVVSRAVPANVLERLGQLRQELFVILANVCAIGRKDGNRVRVLSLDFGQKGVARGNVGVDDRRPLAVLVELSVC